MTDGKEAFSSLRARQPIPYAVQIRSLLSAVDVNLHLAVPSFSTLTCTFCHWLLVRLVTYFLPSIPGCYCKILPVFGMLLKTCVAT